MAGEEKKDSTNGEVRDEGTHTHPLQHSWCLWVLTHRLGSQRGKWSDSQQKVHEFGTVEEFWQMQHNIHAPSRLENADYSIFKKNVAPAWEDPACRNGGRWIVKLEKVRAQSLDDLWLSLVLNMLGESFPEQGGDEVCGGVVSVRSRASKVALWMARAPDEANVMRVGRSFQDVLVKTPGLKELAARTDLSFEDFRRGTITFTLRPRGAGNVGQSGGHYYQ